MDRDGLIEVGPPMRAATHRGIIGFFLFTLIATTATNLAAPLPLPNLVGAEKRDFEAADASAKWSDGSLAKRIEVHERLRSRVSRSVGPLKAVAGLRLLNEAKSGVTCGPNGWLFLDARIGTNIATPDEALTSTSLRLLQAIARRFEGHGTRLVTVPIPRKCSAVAEEFPANQDRRSGVDELTFDELARLGIDFLDLRPTLAALPVEQRFFRYDTHWTRWAMLAAAEAMTKHAGQLTAAPTSSTDQVGMATENTDILPSAGIPQGSWVRTLLQLESLPYPLVARGPANSQVRVETETVPRLALFGTSFSSNLTLYLSHFAGEPVFDGEGRGVRFLGRMAEAFEQGLVSKMPELAWNEVPVHQMFEADRTAVARWLPEHARAFTAVPVAFARRIPLDGDAPEAKERYRIKSGRIITSGTGIVSVRGRASAGGGRWRVLTRTCSFDWDWPGSHTEVSIPLIDKGDLGTWVRVVPLDDKAASTDAQFELTVDLDVAAVGAGQVGAIERSAEGPRPEWRQSIEFGALPIERYMGLALALAPDPAGRMIQVTLHSTDGLTIPLKAEARDLEAVVLDLSPLVGASLARVSFSGSGPNPTWMIQSAAVHRIMAPNER